MFGVGLLMWLKQKRDGWNPERAKRRRGILRLTAYLVVVASAFGVCGYKKAQAELGKASMTIGHDLMPLADLLDETHSMHVNGEQVFMSNALVKEPLGKVLDRFDGHCQKGEPTLGEAWRALPKEEQTPSSALYPLRKGVLRSETNGEGVVMCLAKGSQTPPGFVDSLTQFAESYDLGKLGKLRYAYARSSPDGRSTHVMTVWTENSFNFERILPAEGAEPPGGDPKEAPRPPGGTRIFSAQMDGTPYGVYLFRSTEPPAKVVDFYDKEMTDREWLPVKAPIEGGEGRGYTKMGAHIVIDVSKDEEGTGVSIVEASTDPNFDPTKLAQPRP